MPKNKVNRDLIIYIETHTPLECICLPKFMLNRQLISALGLMF